MHGMAMSDGEIVEGLRRADPAAFREAYARHRSEVLTFLLRLARARDIAEDLAQETWLRLARRAVELTPETRLRPWLFTVARNLFVSHRRSVLVDRDRLERLGLVPRTAAPTPLEEATASETGRSVERALARLPLDQREACLLVSVHGFSYEEASAMTNATEETLRKRVSRARVTISAELGKS